MRTCKSILLFVLALGMLCLLSACLVKQDTTTDANPTSSANVLPFEDATPSTTPAPEGNTGEGGITVGLATAPVDATVTAPIQVITSAPTVNPGSVAANIVPQATTAVPGATVARTATPTAKPTASPTPDDGTLRNGSNGDAVRSLQRALKDLGYYSGSVDGDFGAGTESAVRAFQRNNGLSADGVAGSRTLSALTDGSAKKAATATPRVTPKATSRTTPRTYTASTPGTYRYLQLGSSGSDVKKLQQRLKDLGYYAGSVNGSYGEDTEAAIFSFQQRNGLWVDGVAGEDTQRMLFSSDALYH